MASNIGVGVGVGVSESGSALWERCASAGWGYAKKMSRRYRCRHKVSDAKIDATKPSVNRVGHMQHLGILTVQAAVRLRCAVPAQLAATERNWQGDTGVGTKSAA